MKKTETCFAVAAPGLEAFTAAELTRLGLLPADSPARLVSETGEDAGGVEFEAGLPGIYLANLHLRTASRVLVRLGSFYTTTFSQLRQEAGRLPWERYLIPARPVAIRVTCHKSRLYHSDAVAERVAGAIADRLRKACPVVKSAADDPEPPQLIVVRLTNDLCTISVDSSGALLHRRGYRLATAKAPLRETLAAGMLLAAGYDGSAPLLDPFCGSGTIAIEAALLARRFAPGRHRRFAFMNWPHYDSTAYQKLLNEANAAILNTVAPIFASDRDAGAIEMAKANAERAGVLKNIEFTCQAVSSLQPPAGPGWVITNPPYGVRVASSKDLRNLYARFGQLLREHFPGWQLAVLCSENALLNQMGLPLDRSLGLVNGGIPVRLARATLPPVADPQEK